MCDRPSLRLADPDGTEDGVDFPLHFAHARPQDFGMRLLGKVVEMVELGLRCDCASV
jgi:hypothetical protein